MGRRPFLAIVLALSAFALAACADETTQPNSATEPQAIAPELAVASNTWVLRRDMPFQRSGLTTAVVPNASGQSILYAIGGTSGGDAALSRVQAYNVATNTWSWKAPLPTPLFWTNGAGVINGKIYVSGGATSYRSFVNALFMYDPATNAWTRKRGMPTTTFRGVTGVLNGRLYVLTGCDQEDCENFVQQAFYRYDPATDQWATLPTPSNYHASWGMAAVIGGKFYVAGGSSGGAELDVYDPVTNRWTTKAPLPQPRWLGGAAALGGRLYVIGGLRQDPDGVVAVRSVTVYNPATNTWGNKAPLPDARISIAASRVVLNGQARIEVVGGSLPGNNLQYIP
jgi:N-acetylneuraminic acid mutarotase